MGVTDMHALTLMDKFGVLTRGIIHVGASWGQEFPAYRDSTAKTVLYIEPIDDIFDRLKANVSGAEGHHAIQALCSNRSGQKVNFNIANNGGESSSILPLGNHAELLPHIEYVDTQKIATTTLDRLLKGRWDPSELNLLVIDAQGADLLVLQGAKQLLKHVDGVYVEASEIPLYEGGCTWHEIVDFLRPFGLNMKMINIGTKHWGNAFFLKDSSTLDAMPLTERKAPGPNIALNCPASQSSYYQDNQRLSSDRAVSGSKSGLSAFHTAKEDNPWWQVDLEKIHKLSEIRVYNRMDAASGRANFLKVKISTDGKKWRQVHDQAGVAFGGIDGRPAIISLDKQRARFVKIELGREGFLHLDEVEVYGERSR